MRMESHRIADRDDEEADQMIIYKKKINKIRRTARLCYCVLYYIVFRLYSMIQTKMHRLLWLGGGSKSE